MKRYQSACIAFLSVIALDRLTKWWALRSCVDEVVVTPWLSCSLTFNRGVSWSLFEQVSDAGLNILTAGIGFLIGVLVWYAWKRYKNGHSVIIESVILAGAVSNFVDRLWYGAVVDFIVAHYHGWIWPVFNIADVALVIGVCAVVIFHEE